MTTAELFLPWPDRRLSPNARLHWGALARVKKKARKDAYYAALAAKVGKVIADEIRVTLTFYPPAAYRYDDDGLSSRMKAALDGVAEAIGVDDNKFRLGPIDRGPTREGGEVKVTLEWTEEAGEAA